MFTDSSRRRHLFVAVGLTAAAATAATSLGANAGSTQTGGAALAQAVDAARTAASGPVLTPESAEGRKHVAGIDALRSQGQRSLSKISLPPGESLSVAWDAAAAQGGDNAYGVDLTVNFNAACHWVRYYVDHKSDPQATNGLAAVAKWPAIRAFAGGQAHFEALAAAARRGDSAPAQDELRLNCPGV